jgi:hypothetical protein
MNPAFDPLSFSAMDKKIASIRSSVDQAAAWVHSSFAQATAQ